MCSSIFEGERLVLGPLGLVGHLLNNMDLLLSEPTAPEGLGLGGV